MVIGPGGKTIRRLQEETGAKIDIDDTGVVTLSSQEAAGAEAARDKIVAMTEGVQVGRIYEGRVTSIKEFGVFVEILPGKDGLVHISELSDGYVSNVTEVCRVETRCWSRRSRSTIRIVSSYRVKRLWPNAVRSTSSRAGPDHRSPVVVVVIGADLAIEAARGADHRRGVLPTGAIAIAIVIGAMAAIGAARGPGRP